MTDSTKANGPTAGTLIGVGVGPGDPDLVTIRALAWLRRADVAFVPVGDHGELGRAEAIVAAHVDRPVQRLVFALGNNPAQRARNWTDAAHEVVKVLRTGRSAAFATIGDPSLYSTFTYLAREVLALLPSAAVELVPGITAMQDLAARTATVLAEGNQRLTILPLAEGITHAQRALSGQEALVCYKGGAHVQDLIAAVRGAGRLSHAVYGGALGMPEECIAALEDAPDSGPYLSTVIVPAEGSQGLRP